MIRWEKRGRIFVPDGSIPWMRSHATLPVAHRLSDSVLRIHFAGRDSQNRADRLARCGSPRPSEACRCEP